MAKTRTFRITQNSVTGKWYLLDKKNVGTTGLATREDALAMADRMGWIVSNREG